MSGPLDAVMEWLRTASDGLRVARRVLTGDPAKAVNDKHVFYYDPTPDHSVRRLDAARNEIDDLAIVVMVAVFERRLRDHLAGLPPVAVPFSDPLAEAVRGQLLDDMEFWENSKKLLGLFQSSVPADLIGQVRQIIDYRNWVAHGRNPRKPPGVTLTPVQVHERLSEFLRLAGAVRIATSHPPPPA